MLVHALSPPSKIVISKDEISPPYGVVRSSLSYSPRKNGLKSRLKPYYLPSPSV